MTAPNNDPQKALTSALEEANVSLQALALLKLADEFYSKDQRVQLYAEHAALCAADTMAYKALKEATEANEKVTHEAAFLAKRAASQAVMAFEKEHKLILRLLQARATLSKGPYD